MPNHPAENRRMVSLRMLRDVADPAAAEAARRGVSLTKLIEQLLARELGIEGVTPQPPQR